MAAKRPPFSRQQITTNNYGREAGAFLKPTNNKNYGREAAAFLKNKIMGLFFWTIGNHKSQLGPRSGRFLKFCINWEQHLRPRSGRFFFKATNYNNYNNGTLLDIWE
jgi:hypothetical protein